MKAGFGMNIIGIIVVTISINTYGRAYFDLNQYPAWALAASSKVQCAGLATVSTTAMLNTTATTLSPNGTI